jgi:hypothetical protein
LTGGVDTSGLGGGSLFFVFSAGTAFDLSAVFEVEVLVAVLEISTSCLAAFLLFAGGGKTAGEWCTVV